MLIAHLQIKYKASVGDDPSREPLPLAKPDGVQINAPHKIRFSRRVLPPAGVAVQTAQSPADAKHHQSRTLLIVVDEVPKATLLCAIRSAARSLRLDAALLHDAFPFFHVRDHVGAELGRAHPHDCGAISIELLPHPW